MVHIVQFKSVLNKYPVKRRSITVLPFYRKGYYPLLSFFSPFEFPYHFMKFTELVRYLSVIKYFPGIIHNYDMMAFASYVDSAGQTLHPLILLCVFDSLWLCQYRLSCL